MGTSESVRSLQETESSTLEDGDTRPTTRIELLAPQFVAVVFAGVGVIVVALSVIYAVDVTLRHDVPDRAGSSQKADDWVSFYQTVNGFLVSGLGLLLEQYFEIFLAVMVVFFANRKWLPKEPAPDAHGQMPPYKRIALAFFTPFAMYVVNIGLTSVFIEHRASNVHHTFVDGDLVAISQYAAPTSGEYGPGNGTSVYDTILRVAVRGSVVPFQITDTICGNVNISAARPGDVTQDQQDESSDSQPTVSDVESTSVSYAFPSHTWYARAIPRAIKASHSIEFKFQDVNGSMAEVEEKRFLEFLQETNESLTTIHELVVQGTTLFSKSMVDSNAWLDYPCTAADGKEGPDPRWDTTGSSRKSICGNASSDEWESICGGGFAVYTDDDDEMLSGFRKCIGSSPSWKVGVSFAEPSKYELKRIMTIASVLTIYPENDMVMKIEKITISPQVHLTALSVDLPYPRQVGYRTNTPDQCAEMEIPRTSEQESEAEAMLHEL